jgi:hypothetical protein
MHQQQQQQQQQAFLGDLALHVSTAPAAAGGVGAKPARRRAAVLRAASLAQLRVVPAAAPGAGPTISLHLQGRHCLAAQQVWPGRAALKLLPPQLTSGAWVLLLPSPAAERLEVRAGGQAGGAGRRASACCCVAARSGLPAAPAPSAGVRVAAGARASRR